MGRFKQVTIVGLGLIGGSLGMALRRRRLAARVVGLSRRSATLRRAKRCGAIDWGTTDARRAVEDADVVVLATPVGTIVPLGQRLARWMSPGSVLTDVGSTKGWIVHELERTLPTHVAFVGAHPLAGSERRGIDAACAQLFDGSRCILTATRRSDRRAVRTVTRLWTPLVRRVTVMDPARHDRLLAAVSHLPHLIAFGLVQTTGADAMALAPRSFLDATRVAKSDPSLWEAIFLTNRKALLPAMAQFKRRCQMVRGLVKRGDRAGLRRFLASAKAKRDACDDDAS